MAKKREEKNTEKSSSRREQEGTRREVEVEHIRILRIN
jgi:hypothetical protein